MVKESKKGEKSKPGRKPTFTQKHKEVMLKLAPRGFSNDEIADIIGCDRATFYRWLQKDPVLGDSLKLAKVEVDDQVERSLLEKAVGGYTTEEVTEEVNPETGNVITRIIKKKQHASDTTSMIFWLKNRRPDTWREKRDIEVTGDSVINIKVEDEDL